jgi:hypothetical protein
VVAAVQRRIRHACLRCARVEHAAHARVLLEDALRTASLPDQGRLWVFRCVDLGRLSPRGSATTWSRRLELRLQQLAAGAVSFAEPAAATAEVVWFPDAWLPAIELAVRVLRGPTPVAWFWSAAVPGWTPGLPPRETARLVVRRLEERGGRPATLALARRLWREERLLEFAEWLSPAELSAWTLPPAGDTENGGADRGKKLWSPVWRALPGRALNLLRDWVRTRHPAPAVRAWVLAGVLAEQRAAPAEPEALRHAAAEFSAQLETTTPAGPPPAPAAPPAPTGPRQPGALCCTADRSDTSAAPEAQPREPTTPTTRPTAAGGLLFTLNLLRQLAWPEWLPAGTRPQAAELTVNWLRVQAQRLALPVDDALLAWLADWGELPEFPGSAAPPDSLREGLSPARAARVLQWPLQISLTLAVQRRCWRRARLGWRPLVRRPARLSWTATHVDVFFTHRQADVRVRRAGLDLDPGWVPWLGRVVSFHYVETPPA